MERSALVSNKHPITVTVATPLPDCVINVGLTSFVPAGLRANNAHHKKQCDGLGAARAQGVRIEEFVKLYTDFGRYASRQAHFVRKLCAVLLSYHWCSVLSAAARFNEGTS